MITTAYTPKQIDRRRDSEFRRREIERCRQGVTYEYDPDHVRFAYDRFTGHRLGVVLEIKTTDMGEWVTFRSDKTRGIHTERAMWLTVVEATS